MATHAVESARSAKPAKSASSNPQVLEAVQAAYDSRSGAGVMLLPLKRSPQTERQRAFVRSFVSAVRAARRYTNDLEMSDSGGMPRGYL